MPPAATRSAEDVTVNQKTTGPPGNGPQAADQQTRRRLLDADHHQLHRAVTAERRDRPPGDAPVTHASPTPADEAAATAPPRATRLARLHPDCPTRPVDWRWMKAGLMLDLGLRWSRRR